MIRLALTIVLAAAACGDQIKLADGVACSDDAACMILNVAGTCQSSGFCAYPDGSCAGGLRYSPGATGMENACVGGCGMADGAPCCDENVCGANLVCSAAGTCACGAADEPCCDGATCDTGLACAQGTCKAGIEQVALGRLSMCVLRSDGSVVCSGSDAFHYGRSDPAGTTEVMPFEPRVVAIDHVAELGRGDGHVCVRKTDGSVWCWGHGERGQLGNGSMTSSTVPVQVTGLIATQLSNGRMHSCAAGTVGGTTGIYCWGRNGRQPTPLAAMGRLGNGTTANSAVPVAVDMSQMAATGQTVRKVTAGPYHTCAVMSDDKVWCWGKNDNGELGDGSVISAMAPVLVDLTGITIPNGVTIADVVLGSPRNDSPCTCIRLSNGTAYCWGANNRGQLGDGQTAPRTTPSAPVDMTPLGTATFTALVSNGGGMCGLDSTGKVWCWGDRFQGAAGNNVVDHGSVRTPSQVMGLPTSVASIYGGHRAACALDANKHMWCWGSNRGGQLTRTVPMTVAQGHLLVATDVTP